MIVRPDELEDLEAGACIYPDSDDAFMVLEIVSGSVDSNGIIKYGPAFDLF